MTRLSECVDAYAGLRNDGLMPLSTIHGYVHLLLRDAFGPLTEEQRQALGVISDQTQRAIHTWNRGSYYMRLHEHDITIRPASITTIVEALHATTTHIKLAVTGDPKACVLCDTHLLAVALDYLAIPSAIDTDITPDRHPYIHIVEADAVMTFQIRSLETYTSDHYTSVVGFPGTHLHIATRVLQGHNALLEWLPSGPYDFQFSLSKCGC